MAERSSSADCNLLCGVLAMQAKMLDYDQWGQACAVWATKRDTPMPQVLCDLGFISPPKKANLEKQMELTLKEHGGNASESLNAIAQKDAETLNSFENLARVFDPSSVDKFVPEATDWSERYEKLDKVPRKGGIGQVWRTKDKRLEREVALKELRPEKPADRARFRHEAQISSQLAHPNIVPVYELGEDEDFFTMHFVKGRTLAEACRAFHQLRESGHKKTHPTDSFNEMAKGRGYITSDDVKPFFKEMFEQFVKEQGITDGKVNLEKHLAFSDQMRQNFQKAVSKEFRGLITAILAVCQAVAYAHSRGVIHRDLKPGNVNVDVDGKVYLLDWGLAKVIGNHLEEGQDPVIVDTLLPGHDTVRGDAVGTPGFMSPEQAAGRLEEVGPASDVYSLGATLYCLLTGRSSPKRDQSDDLPRPRKINREVDRALEAICLKAMAPAPKDRYGLAHDLAADLELWLSDKPVSAWAEPWTLRARRWASKHHTFVTVTFAVFVMGLLAATSGTVWYELDQANKERAWQEARLQTEREANLVLGKIIELREQAQKMPVQTPLEMKQALDLWHKCSQNMDKVEAVLAKGVADDNLRSKVDEIRGQVDLGLKSAEAELTRINKEASLLYALETAQLMTAQRYDAIDWGGASYRYETALVEFGIPVIKGRSSQDIATAIGNVRAELRPSLIAALDHWSLCREDHRYPDLRKAARLADNDPWRQRLRDVLDANDVNALKKMSTEAQQQPLPLASLLLLSESLLHLQAWEELEVLLRQVREDRTDDFWVHYLLGLAVERKAAKSGNSPLRLEEAIGCYRAAFALRPTNVIRNRLGVVLQRKGDLDGALLQYKKAVDNDPKFARAHYNLAAALTKKRQTDLAAKHYLIVVNQDQHLTWEKKKVAEKMLAKKGTVSGMRSVATKELSPEQLDRLRRRQRLFNTMEDQFLKERAPHLPEEFLDIFGPEWNHKVLYQMGFYTSAKEYASLARWCDKLFISSLKTAGNLDQEFRYVAACAAVLAADGKGSEELKPSDIPELRLLALKWLQADLESWRSRLKMPISGELSPQEAGMRRVFVCLKMHSWLRESDLESVRDPAALGKLPMAEQVAWQLFWQQVYSFHEREDLDGIIAEYSSWPSRKNTDDAE